MYQSKLISIFVVLLFGLNVFADLNRRQIGNVMTEEIPEIPLQTSERMLQYQNARSAGFCGWHPSGKGLFIKTRFGRTTQIHYVQSAGAARQQLTFFNEPIAHVAVTPAGDMNEPTLVFTKDIGGNEYFQIYSYSMSTSAVTMLTDGTSLNNLPVWSDDGKYMAYYSTRRNGKDWDIYTMPVSDYKNPTRIIEKGGYWYPLDFSPDGKKLLVKKHVSVNESYLFIYDIADKSLKPVNPASMPISYGQAFWASDGVDLYLTSNQEGLFHSLFRYNLRTQDMKEITSGIDWDVSEFTCSADRKTLAFVVNENGLSMLYIYSDSNDSPIAVREIPKGQVSNLHFHPKDLRLGFTLNSSIHPADVFEYDCIQQKLVRWTESELGGLDSNNLIQPELVHIPTFDQVDGKPRQIPAFLYKPKTKGPWPVLINIHGGPESQYKPGFSFRTQYWVNELGIAVLSPNVRGSTGYGKEYVNLDNGYLREDSVKDIGAILDWIQNDDSFDESRVGVFGVSYGGYMVLASMIHYDDRLKCGIDVVGISNFVSFLENTEDHRRDRRRVEYGDERDEKMREFLIKISPTTNAHKIKKPILIAQGLNDPRVPASESEQMVQEIRKNGQSVWYFLAKDEGHIFRKKNNSDLFYNTVSLFLEKYLLE